MPVYKNRETQRVEKVNGGEGFMNSRPSAL